MCGATNDLALYQHHTHALASSRCGGRIACRAATNNHEALIEVHVFEVIGATVVVVVVGVDDDVDVVVVDVDVGGPNSGNVVVGIGMLFGQ